MFINRFMDSKNQKYSKIHILEVLNLENFILWLKEQSYTLALRHIGHLFFKDALKYQDNFINCDDDEITDEDIFVELFPVLIEDEKDINKYYITSKDTTHVIRNISNMFLYAFINQLVDCGLLEMCWDSHKEDFIWRLAKNI